MAEDLGTQETSVTVETIIAADNRTATLSFKGGDNIWEATADTPSIEMLLVRLGDVRRRMLEPVPDSPDDAAPAVRWTTQNPRWFIPHDPVNDCAPLWLRHDAFGWTGYFFPRGEAASVTRAFRKPLTKIQDKPNPSATSFGNDSFLITTERLGFYYYGKGDKKIGRNPFEQVEFDSDRAAGLVAGAIVERRLEEALRSRFHVDDKDISKELFHPSGPLGSFKVKIDLAYSMGIVSKVAHKDLINLKNIRNRFAHYLELDSFDAPDIKVRCTNFALIDRHVGPVPSRDELLSRTASGLAAPQGPHPYLGLPDYQVKLADPRFRYVMTAQLFSFVLGMGSEDEKIPLPLI
jgi:Mannitol repressor